MPNRRPPEGAPSATGRSRALGIAGLLVLATLAAYEPLFHNEFVSLDDNLYVTKNATVQQGLSWETVRWAFTTQAAGNWHPLTWLSHLLDVQLFGLDPVGHHATSLALHLATTLLLLRVLWGLTGALWPSSFVAAIFALHPLHVESVAWVAERKDLLAGLFFVLTLGAWARWVERPGRLRYALVLLALACGLMAKPMLVTVPFLLLLLDYWPLGRMNWKREHEPQGPTLSRLLGEKVPLFTLVAASSVMTYWAQQAGGAVEDVPLGARLSNALVAWVGYAAKLAWPDRLAVMYPYPALGWPVWQTLLSGAVLVGVSAAALRLGRRYRYLPVGWFWYAGMLVPVIGLVQVGYQASADRYTYLPSIGLSIVIAWGTTDLAKRTRLSYAWLAVPAAVALAAMILTTRAQVGHWRNTFTLYEHAVSVTDNNYVMYANLGVAHGNRGESDRAVFYLEQAVRANPRFDHGHYNLAVELQKRGRLDEAIEHYRAAIDVTPDYSSAHANLAGLFAARGDFDGSIHHMQRVLEGRPDDVRTRFRLAVALHTRGRLDEAVQEYRSILRRSPSLPQVHRNLGRALESLGQNDEAQRHFRTAQQLEGG